MRDFHLPGRSTVHSLAGIVATSHPVSTQVGLKILEQGGNAVDAAIAAAAVQAVVEPHSTGIGGDCFVLYAPKGSGRVVGLNGSGHAPRAASVDWYLNNGLSAIPIESPHAVTVPGAVDAWLRLLEDHGSMSRSTVLAPAIALAHEGYVVQPRSAYDWPKSVAKLKRDPTAARIFLPGGGPPKLGQLLQQPELARTLSAISEYGRDGFYSGSVAEDIVGFLRSLGGLHDLDDFASQSSEYVDPISLRYRGFDVYQCPPNGQGLAVLLMLGILENFDLHEFPAMSVERMHLEAEATRLAYHLCELHVADPRFVSIPLDELLSRENLRRLSDRIHLDRVMTDVPDTAPMHPETIYLTVVDRERNAVSLINSVCFAFGSGLVSPRSGVLLHNRGGSFKVEKGHLNCIAGRKRPRHTIIPGMVYRDGRVALSFGVMGGQFQPVGQTHVLTNIIDYGLDVQEALDLGRGFRFGGTYACEHGIPDHIVAGLAALGHRSERAGAPLGSGQAIWIDWENNGLVGGSDHRKDGMALGLY